MRLAIHLLLPIGSLSYCTLSDVACFQRLITMLIHFRPDLCTILHIYAPFRRIERIRLLLILARRYRPKSRVQHFFPWCHYHEYAGVSDVLHRLALGTVRNLLDGR